MGEPLNAEAVIWSQEVFGKPFHDTFWQTETGCIVITNFPGMPIKPGSMGKPFPGITATVLNPKTYEPVNQPGVAGPDRAAPGLAVAVPRLLEERGGFQTKFKNGWYLCGDRASIDADGYFWFMGRDDDVINTGGHLVGPFEIESALLEHPAVPESAAVAKPDPVNMEVVKAFVTLKRGYRAIGRSGTGNHEPHSQAAVAAGHAAGNRVRGFPAQDPQRQDRAPDSALQGVPRAGGRSFHHYERLKRDGCANRRTGQWTKSPKWCAIT